MVSKPSPKQELFLHLSEMSNERKHLYADFFGLSRQENSPGADTRTAQGQHFVPALRVQVVFEYMAMDAEKYSNAPGPLLGADRNAACCTQYIRHCPFLAPCTLCSQSQRSCRPQSRESRQEAARTQGRTADSTINNPPRRTVAGWFFRVSFNASRARNADASGWWRLWWAAPQHAQLSVESRKRRLHPRCRVRHADWDERCRVARAPPAGDQPEDWRATDPETGGHHSQNWTGAVNFQTLTSTVTCPSSVHQRLLLPVGGEPVRLFHGLSEYVGRVRDRR